MLPDPSLRQFVSDGSLGSGSGVIRDIGRDSGSDKTLPPDSQNSVRSWWPLVGQTFSNNYVQSGPLVTISILLKIFKYLQGKKQWDQCPQETSFV